MPCRLFRHRDVRKQSSPSASLMASYLLLRRNPRREGFQILLLQHPFDQLRQPVRCAPEARHAEFGYLLRKVLLEGRDAAVRKRQQADNAHAGFHHVFQAAHELGLVAALEQVGDEEENGLRWVGDELLAIADGLVDVRATTKLDTE